MTSTKSSGTRSVGFEKDKFKTANASNPCPVCGQSKKCGIGINGLISCRGESGDVPGFVCKGPARGDEGFTLYRRDGDDRIGRRPLRRSRAEEKPKGNPWPRMAAFYVQQTKPGDWDYLASLLGLPAGVFGAMEGLGRESKVVSGLGRCGDYMFPERDGDGVIVAIKRRPYDGSDTPKYLSGAVSAGLSIVRGWQERPGPVFLVEGASDTLAATAAGLSAVGRPNNTGGIRFLTTLLRNFPADRQIVVVGERDQKPDGKWPGLDGMIKTAADLSRKLGRDVLTAMMPSSDKDVRAFLIRRVAEGASWADAGAELAQFLASVTQPLTVARSDSFLDLASVAPGSVTTSDTSPPETPNPPAPGVVFDEVASWAKIYSNPDNGAADDDPHRLARRFLAKYVHGRERTLRFWRDAFHKWESGAYTPVADSDIDSKVTRFTDEEFTFLFALKPEPRPDDDKPPQTKNKVTRSLVNNVIGAVRGEAHLDLADAQPPCWLQQETGDPRPDELVVFRNGLLHLPAFAQDATTPLIPPTPRFFTPNRLEFAFDRDAAKPSNWLRFLDELWPGDPEAVSCLQQWFGYVITSSTRLQKMLILVGPPRGGKGTIFHVMQSLVGQRNATSVRLADFGSNFGLQQLPYKSLAVIDDMRVSHMTDRGAVTQALLSITGESIQPVHRKHKESLSLKLPTRFVILTNELPALLDSSGALATRSIFLKLHNSWTGKEDVTLIDRLLAELPGILLWAVDGWKQLQSIGHIKQPASGMDLVRTFQAITSPITTFVDEECVLGPPDFNQIVTETLFEQWGKWCERQGIEQKGTLEMFGKNLFAKYPSVAKKRAPRALRHQFGGKRPNMYFGIRLRSENDPDPDPEEVDLNG